MGTLNTATDTIHLGSNNGTQFRMYGHDWQQGSRCFYISGLYGPHLFVYADCLQSAFDVVADESEEFVGMYVDAQVNETIRELQEAAAVDNPEVLEGDCEAMEAIWEEAESNTFTVGNYSRRLQSDEWHAQEVTRAQMFELRGY